MLLRFQPLLALPLRLGQTEIYRQQTVRVSRGLVHGRHGHAPGVLPEQVFRGHAAGNTLGVKEILCDKSQEISKFSKKLIFF